LFPGDGLVAAGAEQAQHHEEEVDEVEVQGERPEDGAPAHGRGIVGRRHLAHDLELLGVVGGQSQKDEHADAGDDEVHHRALREDVDHRGDDDADKAHEQEAAKRGQVLAGEQAVQAHGAEHAARDEKGVHDGGLGVDREDRRQGDAV